MFFIVSISDMHFGFERRFFSDPDFSTPAGYLISWILHYLKAIYLTYSSEMSEKDAQYSVCQSQLE